LSATGDCWISKDESVQARAYHALIILPSDATENGYVSSNDGVTNSDTLKWLSEEALVGNNQTQQGYELKVAYDSVFQTVTVDSKSYSLAKGNLFIIRLDKEGQTQVTQLNELFTENNDIQARESFKRATRNEEFIQRVL
jgi:hypothetical protein